MSPKKAETKATTAASKKKAAKSPKKVSKGLAKQVEARATAAASKKKAAKSPKKVSKGLAKKVEAKATATASKKKATKPPKKVKKASAKKAAAPKKNVVRKKKSASTAVKKAPKKTKATVTKKKSTAKKSKSTAPKSKASTAAVVKYDPLQRYLNEISHYSLITREREIELGILIQEEGDTEAAYELVTSNLRLVVKIALEFQRIWMQNLLDLIQEGNMGLMQAVKKFDPYKNVKFSYYASFWIKAYILKFIMDNWRLVKIGTTQGQRKLFFKLKKEKRRLVEEGFDPKPKLLSKRLGVSEQEVVDMDQRLSSWDVSLNAPLKDDSDTTRADLLSVETETTEDTMAKKEMDVLLHQKIDEFRKQMSERELDIFDRRIFSDSPETLQEIGDRYHISRERVRQVEKNIIKKMRLFFQKEIPDFDVYAMGQGTDGDK